MEIVSKRESNLPDITIRLTAKEAWVLYRLVGKIGGSPTGPREVTDSLYGKLSEFYPEFRNKTGNIVGSPNLWLVDKYPEGLGL